MNSAIERLLELKVKDIMSKEVIEVSPNHSMRDAAKILVNHSVTGVPVVDEMRHCVGMLSSTDYLACHVDEQDDEFSPGPEHEVTHKKNKSFHIEASPREFVSDHMASAVQSISLDSSLMTAARMMLAEHVHRLPVLDKKGHVIGLVSTLDIVAALIHAIEE